MTGTVKWFGIKGYGFIIPDDNGSDIFVHFRDIVGREILNKDDRVEFETAEGDERGPRAINVRLIETELKREVKDKLSETEKDSIDEKLRYNTDNIPEPFDNHSKV